MAKTKSKYLVSLEEAVRECDALRMDPDNPQDIALAQYVKLRWGVSMETFYQDLKINPGKDTIQNIINLPDKTNRWLIPEIYRAAVRLGQRKQAIYKALIAATQNIKGLEVTQPWINKSDATPLYTGIAETIRLGDISFGSKTVKVRKIARGIKIPYEVKNYVALNVVQIFMQDYGIQMGLAKDMDAITTLINGDQVDGSASAPVIGVKTPNTIVYKDMLKPLVRESLMGRRITTMIGGEDIALDILDLDEFKKRESGTTESKLNVKTPIPTSLDFYIHGGMPEDQILMVDPSVTMIEYIAQPLLVESEKIVSNQTEATYASETCGFGIAYRDGRVIVDRSLDFSTNGFPPYMDVAATEIVRFTK